MNSAARITSQLEMMAGEAAHLYDSLCRLDGDQPLLDPHNVAFMERTLAEQAEGYREIWARQNPASHHRNRGA